MGTFAANRLLHCRWWWGPDANSPATWVWGGGTQGGGTQGGGAQGGGGTAVSGREQVSQAPPFPSGEGSPDGCGPRAEKARKMDEEPWKLLDGPDEVADQERHEKKYVRLSSSSKNMVGFEWLVVYVFFSDIHIPYLYRCIGIFRSLYVHIRSYLLAHTYTSCSLAACVHMHIEFHCSWSEFRNKHLSRYALSVCGWNQAKATPQNQHVLTLEKRHS